MYIIIHETYAYTAHVLQLKSWRILCEDYDECNDEVQPDDEVRSDAKWGERDLAATVQTSVNAESFQHRQSTRNRQVHTWLKDYELGWP